MEANGGPSEDLKPQIKLETNADIDEPFQFPETSKISQILDAIKWKDTENLRALAASESGLIPDEIRRKACQF